jgi:predicted esterase
MQPKVVAVAVLLGCSTPVSRLAPVVTTQSTRDDHASQPVAPAADEDDVPNAPVGLPPLGEGDAWLDTVTLDDGSQANVALPLGATSPRPLVVGVHGSGDRPDWSCAEWANVVDSYAFVVCPHGSAFGGGFAWSTIEQLDKRVISAITAVRAKYGAYVDGGPAIYAGFSQGANLAPYIVRNHADVFPMIALDEGGYAQAYDFGLTFAHGGGKRALLSCSTFRCETDFTASERTLAKSGVDVRVSKLGAFGHTMNQRATSALHEQWKWLVRDDARWSSWLAASS